MLSEITIENVAVIEKATVRFGAGFNVLTGETGAGKSILIDSINAILGNRTSRDIVRSGAEKARIFASFQGVGADVSTQLAAAGYPCEEELLLQREVSADGKSACRINGMPATAAMLREVCGGLVNIHGQNDNQSLLDAARHLAVLDAFARNEQLLAQYAAAYEQLVAVQAEMKTLSMNEAEKNRKMDLLRYEVEEIELADLVDGEEEELADQRNVIRHAQNILAGLSAAYEALSGGDEGAGAATLLGSAAGEVEAAAKYAPDLAPYAESLNELYYSAKETASDLQHHLANYDFDPRALDEVEARLDLIYRMKQKYGADIPAILQYGAKAREELENIEFSAERMVALAQQEEKLAAEAGRLANALTDSRSAAFERLDAEIADALAFLNMPGITMTLKMDQAPLSPTGQDLVEFYISTNAGEAPKPLIKIASGGELARIMLALKSALADRDAVPTVIYDEIDTGISGSAAGRIGQMLRDTSRGRQVICVTHTAQIAAYAARHLLIEKQVEGGRTYTHIRELAPPQRTEELARIISGDHVTDIARANAQEMLVHAQQPVG